MKYYPGKEKADLLFRMFAAAGLAAVSLPDRMLGWSVTFQG
jgi:hypothetical protein